MNKMSIVWIVGTVVVVAGLFVYLRPGSTPEVMQVATGTPVASPTPDADTFVFGVTGGKVTAPEKFSTTQGRDVILQITSDVREEVHLHGYNVSKEVAAGEMIELRFIAATAGRFEVELEGHKQTLGFLEVLPK